MTDLVSPPAGPAVEHDRDLVRSAPERDHHRPGGPALEHGPQFTERELPIPPARPHPVGTL